jgi:hypothetical protein
MKLGSRALLALGAFATAFIVFFPRETQAEEIPDYERQGEYDDEGHLRFGEISLKGELTKTASGWILVRTYENNSDEPQSCTVEERILEQETMRNSRVGPPTNAIITRTQVLKLGPHEKRSIGVTFSPEINAKMDESQRIQDIVNAAVARSAETGNYSRQSSLFYTQFSVEYLKPLPPGATAERHPINEGNRFPAAMPAEPMDFGPYDDAEPAPKAKAKVAALPQRGVR